MLCQSPLEPWTTNPFRVHAEAATRPWRQDATAGHVGVCLGSGVWGLGRLELALHKVRLCGVYIYVSISWVRGFRICFSPCLGRIDVARWGCRQVVRTWDLPFAFETERERGREREDLLSELTLFA